jgi:hypothetical protein
MDAGSRRPQWPDFTLSGFYCGHPPKRANNSKKFTPIVKKENAMDPKEKQVLEAMKKHGKPVRPGDIVKITQLESKEVSTIIKNLKKQGKVVSPKQCFYEPV